MGEHTYNFTIFLMKENVDKFEQCIKKTKSVFYSDIKSECALEGKIVISNSSSREPCWKNFLQTISQKELKVENNVSNKAVMLVRIRERILALTFGYGRTLLREENIERNFGFITALNMLDPQKIRSINAVTVEDLVVHVQKQSSYSTGQEEFALDTINDIMMSVTGKAKDAEDAIKVSGKDSLSVTVGVKINKLKYKLEKYLIYYGNQNYKKMGFSWIDNIREIRDSALKEELDVELDKIIKEKDYDNLYISPPDTINWSDNKGFAFSGIRKSIEKIENYKDDIEFKDYLDNVKKDGHFLPKLKQHKLYGLSSNDVPYVICNVFAALVAQVNYDSNTYILCNGRWFRIEKSFYNSVYDYVSQIPIATVDLPKCHNWECEGEYNERVAQSMPGYILMDKKMVGVANGNRKIEACDIFTIDKQFIHVKNKCVSAQLSHLFAQGRVSAECFKGDKEFRKQVSEKISEVLNESVFDYTMKPADDEYEVVFAIIDEKVGKIEDRLPFFSLVNLMTAHQHLDRMSINCSVIMIEKEK